MVGVETLALFAASAELVLTSGVYRNKICYDEKQISAIEKFCGTDTSESELVQHSL